MIKEVLRVGGRYAVAWCLVSSFIGGCDTETPAEEEASLHHLLGTGYQRPFELASRRLLNMASILPRWGSLAPEEASLLTLQGGTFVFRGGETAFAHRDPGILKRASLDAVLAAALERP